MLVVGMIRLMRILIFEPQSTGHHAQYLGHMLRSLGELEQEAIVVTRQQAVESPSFQLHLADVRYATQFDTSVPPAISGTIRDAFAQARQLQRLSNGTVPTISGCRMPII